MITKFRPCIDLHNGKVKQIVGGSLTDSGSELKENFVSDEGAEDFAELYKKDDLRGGHVIQLGPGNQKAAEAALAAYPQGLQLGGGVNLSNAQSWIDKGASHVIVTSCLFDDVGMFLWDELEKISKEIGKDKLVVDLSCRKTSSGWVVAMNRWQKLTNLEVNHQNLSKVAKFCDEFLVHAADVEGLCNGVDRELVSYLGKWSELPMTYAGGVGGMQDVEIVAEASGGNVDLTVGSALDIFGGSEITYKSLVEWNKR